eukprot:6970923-Prymnesium_polylepis.2
MATPPGDGDAVAVETSRLRIMAGSLKSSERSRVGVIGWIRRHVLIAGSMLSSLETVLPKYIRLR